MLKKEFLEFLGSELADINRVMILQSALSEAIHCVEDGYKKKFLINRIDSVNDELIQLQVNKIDAIAYLLLNCDNEKECEESQYFKMINSPMY